MNRTVATRLQEFGLLRILLLTGAVVSLLFRPAPLIDPVYEGWHLFVHLLLPVLAPIQFMLHSLDGLMGLVLMADKTGEARQRYRRIALTQFTVALLLLAYWVPYYIAINTKP